MSARLEDLRELLQRPRSEHVGAVRALLADLPEPEVNEAWNTAFGPGSLFEAWTRTSVASGVYAANQAVIRPWLDGRKGWVAVEIGAGNGELWARTLRSDDVGTLMAIDPSAEALRVLGSRLPEGVTLDARVGRVEDVGALPDADLVVCALTLHHLAGRDAEERARHGLTGPGKTEVLERVARSLTGRGGRLVLSEADIHCEVDLASGSAILRERLLDSYVRRCAVSILDDLFKAEGRLVETDLSNRWRHIARHWCLEQVGMAEVPVAERDVYELDVGRWLEVLDRAGLEVLSQRCSDDYGLFHQYVARP